MLIQTIKQYIQKLFLKKYVKEKIINRSSYKSSLACELSFWNQYYSDNQAVSKYKFFSNQYNEIEDIYRKLFPNSNCIYTNNKEKSCSLTQKFLTESKPIFHASFSFEDLYTKCDLLVPTENGWDVILLKHTPSFKKSFLSDLSYQRYILEKNNIPINNYYAYLINSKYVFDGEIDLNTYIYKKEITDKVHSTNDDIPVRITKLRKLLEQKNFPKKDFTNCCSSPKECSFPDVCWKELKDGDIFQLREGREVSHKLFREGIIYIKDIPSDIELSEVQQIQKKIHTEKSVHVDVPKIQKLLSKVEYPIHFLDFEAVNPSLPIFPKTTPFQHIPFQYSLHVKESKSSELKHYEYINDGTTDPRADIVENLSKLISTSGSIICFNDMLEKKCIKESVQFVGLHEEWYKVIIGNFIDISIPFRNFYYYNYYQKGSASLKTILPILTDLNYKGLEIADGQYANNIFLKLLTGSMDTGEKQTITQNLLEYCQMDSLALVKLLEALEIVANS